MPYPIVFFFYRIAYYLVRIAFFFYYRISFEGRENVPKGTAVIFASNHRSYLDPVLVAMAAPHPFNFIAKEPLFRNPVFGGFIRLMGAFPTADAKHPDYDMLSEATKRLDKRRHLTIFPEGTRHTDGKVGRGKSGVCVLAARSGKPVVPIGLVFDSNNLHFRSRICVRVGKPLYAADYGLNADSTPHETSWTASNLWWRRTRRSRSFTMCRNTALRSRSLRTKNGRLWNRKNRQNKLPTLRRNDRVWLKSLWRNPPASASA